MRRSGLDRVGHKVPAHYEERSRNGWLVVGVEHTLSTRTHPVWDLAEAGNVYGFVDRARDAGADIELVRIPSADHLFDASPIGAQLHKGITLNWLDDQGF